MSSTDSMPPLDIPQPVHLHGFENSFTAILWRFFGQAQQPRRDRTGEHQVFPGPRLLLRLPHRAHRPLPSRQPGLGRVVETRFRRGTVVCPDYPVEVNAYMPNALAEAVLQAMGSGPGGRLLNLTLSDRHSGTPQHPRQDPYALLVPRQPDISILLDRISKF